MTPSHTTAWKGTERRVCRAWGGERRGPDHRKSLSDGDDAVPVSIEVTRTGRPIGEVVKRKWAQCVRNAKADALPPVLVIATPRQQVDEMVAVVNHGWLLTVCKKAGVIS